MTNGRRTVRRARLDLTLSGVAPDRDGTATPMRERLHGPDELRPAGPKGTSRLRGEPNAYSFDILSQFGVAPRSSCAALGGSPARVVLAGGESQSAALLTSYINAVHAGADVFDGFFVNSRPSTAAAASTDRPASTAPTSPAMPYGSATTSRPRSSS